MRTIYIGIAPYEAGIRPCVGSALAYSPMACVNPPPSVQVFVQMITQASSWVAACACGQCGASDEQGFNCSSIGLYCSSIGLHCSLIGLHCSFIGLHCTLIGLDGSTRDYKSDEDLVIDVTHLPYAPMRVLVLGCSFFIFFSFRF